MTLSTYPISNGLPAFNLGPSFLEYAIQREMKMASIKENLIAAKALIDTPEKFAGLEAAAAALDRVTAPRSEERKAVYAAIFHAHDRPNPTDWGNWEHVMDRFDRAIAAQDGA